MMVKLNARPSFCEATVLTTTYLTCEESESIFTSQQKHLDLHPDAVRGYPEDR